MECHQDCCRECSVSSSGGLVVHLWARLALVKYSHPVPPWFWWMLPSFFSVQVYGTRWRMPRNSCRALPVRRHHIELCGNGMFLGENRVSNVFRGLCYCLGYINMASSVQVAVTACVRPCVALLSLHRLIEHGTCVDIVPRISACTESA